MKRNKAFTLVEILIASSIFLILVSTLYSAFHSGILGYRNIERALDIHQAAAQIMQRINTDLRNSFAYTETDTKFKGEKNSIGFLALTDRFSGDSLTRDYAFISYVQQEDKVMRLIRRNEESLKERSEVEPEELASNVRELSFSYGFAGANEAAVEWNDAWNDPQVLPVAVKIKLTLKYKNSREFERTIFLSHG